MNEWTRDDWEQHVQTDALTAFYLYTPMCGTCAIASKMLDVVEQLVPEIPLGKANINYTGKLAYELEIESVPCLVVARDGKVEQKIYAFQSVPFLYEILKK